ncbi:AAA family ATPase [Streptomyces sp. NPDC051940]|uniref:AAA family ATPase n=1 Tax=Streptomyces sp. NPDC051940 TaxID=3155675 RepID=UPI00342DE2F8
MSAASSEPASDLLFVTGPPAVGKMTVGQEIADRTGFRLLHNHLTIEPVLQLFPFGSAPFKRLVGDFRRRLVEEAAASDLPGLIFTYVWAHDVPEDHAVVERYAQCFRVRGGRVLHLELTAELRERLSRNTGPSRLAAKPSKRNVDASRRNLLDLDARHRLNSEPGELDGWADASLRIDNTHRSPQDVANEAIDHFGLAVPREAP